jgi:putative ABC transport system permease protein
MPDWKALVRARLGPLPVDPARQADIVEELAQHAAEHCAELVASGMAEREAIAAALAPLDDRARVAMEIARADRPRHAAPAPPATGGSPAGAFARDVRYAVRLLLRAPGFAAVALVTLALGIGANAAIFSVVRAVILRPPPYRDPARLITFLNSRSETTGAITSSSLPDYQDWRQRLTSFDSFGVLSGWTFNITGLELPERVFGARVSGSLFQTLGTPPLLGRVLTPDDDRPGDEVVVLGYRVWQRLFNGDPSLVGRAVMMEGRPHIVVGVMPPRFRFPGDEYELWAGIKDNMDGMPRNSRFFVAVARLKPSVALSSAQAELDTTTAQLAAAYPDTNKGWRVRLAGVQEATVGQSRPALVALSAAVGLVLLIACANVASLLLARATSRRRETAIRLALGASRARLVSQWMTENLLLAALGGAFGIAIAFAAVRLVVVFGPTDVPRLDETAVDLPVLAFTVLVSIVAGALPAIAPAIRVLRESSASALKEGFGGVATAHGRGGAALVVVEIALAMTLAVAGGLLLKSFSRLSAVDPGFDPSRVLTLKVFLTPPRYRSVESEKQFVRATLDRLARVPGVEQVAAISSLPLGDPASGQPFTIDGRTFAPSQRPNFDYRAISASYLDTMRIPLRRGRRFTDDDRETTARVLLVNEALARAFWPNEDPIGKIIRPATGYPQFDTPHTIVGVVADVKSLGLEKAERPAVYAPFTQREFPWLRWNSFVVRTHGEPEAYGRIIRQEIVAIDPLQPIYQVAAFDTVVSQSVAARRFNTVLIGLFAAVALGLCAVGVYGTIGYWVAERSREIGVRMALGASRRGIRAMVVGRALALTAVGAGAGLVLSAATSRLLETLLYDVHRFDAGTISTVALIVLATGAAAAYVPARRASSLDPLTVIRGD